VIRTSWAQRIAGAKDSYRAIVLSSALLTVVAAQTLGALFASSTAFKMKNGNKRSPNISQYFFLCQGTASGI
jgi:hypothetical protein